MFGFYRIAICVPEVKPGNIGFNKTEIIRCMRKAAQNGAAVLVFPELCITGATCGDLFRQKLLLDKALNALYEIADASAGTDMLTAAGLPLLHNGRLHNCTAMIQNGRIRALTSAVSPDKSHIFSGKIPAGEGEYSNPGPETIPFTNLLDCGDFRIGIETGSDSTLPLPPGQIPAADYNATLILNPSANAALTGEYAYRKQQMEAQSARCTAVYAYASAGAGESSAECVYSGQALICENGTTLAEHNGLERRSVITYADADLEKIQYLRMTRPPVQEQNAPVTWQKIDRLPRIKDLQFRMVNPCPFIPPAENRDSVCSEIFRIQAHGLVRRMEATGAEKLVLGVSGGLDSTLALLVCHEALSILNLPAANTIAITMPGFGTSSRTKGNSEKMAAHLGATLRKIDIKKACLQHFADIGHDKDVHDVAYENTQARERTQILMDVANSEGALLAGTGDLSEIALGWCTYNGDHMSMYGVNCGVPKTAMRSIVDWYAERRTPAGSGLKRVLKDVLATPVSPELLPGAQITENILGAYELHDFYLYHLTRTGASPEKIYFLARKAFAGMYPDAEIRRTLELFLKRFFTQQFKRSCAPDGVKVGTVSLASKTDWRMPSDISGAAWFDDLKGLK